MGWFGSKRLRNFPGGTVIPGGTIIHFGKFFRGMFIPDGTIILQFLLGYISFQSFLLKSTCKE